MRRSMSTSRANDGTGESMSTMLLVGAAGSSLSRVTCSGSVTPWAGSRSTTVNSGGAGEVSTAFSVGLEKTSSSSTTGGGCVALDARAARAASWAARAAVSATRAASAIRRASTVAALRVGGAVGPGRAGGLLCGAHRLFCGAHGLRGPLRLAGAIGLRGAGRLLCGAHRFLRGTSGLSRALGFDRPIRFGLLVRESLRFRELPRLVGGASRLFGRALRLLRDAGRFCGALRLRGALRLESATRFLLGRARLVLCNARLLLRGLRLRRRGVGLAGRVRDRSRLTTDVLEELGEDTAQRVGRERARLGGGLLGRLLRRGSRFAAWSAERGKAAPPVRRDLVDEAVALFTEPLDLFD